MKQSNRRGFLKAAGMLAAGLMTPGFSLASRPKTKPNVLFIAVDDLRPELGCYGANWIKSPHIDELAAEGMVFKRAYCQVAVCGASRASLLTGLRPTADRFLKYYTWAQKEVPGAMTLPEEFRKNGYHCISNGKIFHHQQDTADRSWSDPPFKPRGGWKTLDPASKSMKGKKKGQGPFFEAPDVPDDAYRDGKVAEKTIRDLKRMKQSGKPFFIGCGFFKPHLPFYAPKKYWDLYDRDKIPIADNRFRPQNAPKALRGSKEIRSYHNRFLEYNSREWHKTARHGYAACVSYIDARIGKVMQTLNEIGLRDNTIVILWGDHGWHLGEHNFWSKHNVMHRATHSPLIVSAPGSPKNRSSQRLVEFVDIYPSLCQLAGISTTNQDLQGTSFVPLLNDPDRPWKKAAFSKYGRAVSVITKRYNYSEFKNGQRMLYDRQLDPEENINVAEDPKYQTAVPQLSLLLKNGYQSVFP